MNFIFKTGIQVRLKNTIHSENLKKGSIGTVIYYQDHALSDKFRNKPLDRIECMVIFRKYEGKKQLVIEEPFTEPEARLYLEIYNKEPDEFFI